MCASDRSHKRLSFKALGHRLRSVPMLIISLCLALGIVGAELLFLPLWAVVAALVVAAAMAWVVRSEARWCYCAFALVMLGYLVALMREPSTSMPYDCEGEIIVAVRGVPAERDGYRVAEGRVEAYNFGDGWHEARDRVQLWLRCDSIEEGARVVVRAELVERMSRYEGYNELLTHRGYVGGIAISHHNLLSLERHSATTLQQRAIAKLGRYRGDSLAHATVEAMVAGSRSGVGEELREAYSRTGLSHLMAVSGLHLAVVAMAVAWLLQPLALVHRGHRLRNLLIIVALWLFAIMSGSSPSVLRAATMFSVVQIAYLSSSRYASLNALMATIFLMLVYRPDYLFDISFQLSVAAVLGIVVWAVPLVRSIGHRGGIVRGIASMLGVGVAATLWTMPIISHYFGNLPFVSVVLTPLLMPLAYVVVASGVVALAMPSVVAVPFIVVAEWAAKAQNTIVAFTSQPSWVALEYSLDGWVVGVVYLLYAIITLVIWSIERKKVITL